MYDGDIDFKCTAAGDVIYAPSWLINGIVFLSSIISTGIALLNGVRLQPLCLHIRGFTIIYFEIFSLVSKRRLQ